MATRGASEVSRLRSSLRDAFNRAKSLSNADTEIQSDFARYLCVLVSGFVETCVAELAIEHCKQRSSTTVTNYAAGQLDRLQNLKAQKLVQLVGSFEKKWAIDLSAFMDGAPKEALDSVINLRNKIAHGQSVSLSLGRITQYHEKIDEIIVYVANLLK